MPAALPAVTVAALLCLGACAGGGDTAPPPTPSAATAPTASADPGASASASAAPLSVEVSSGQVTLVITVPGAAIDAPHVAVSDDPADATRTITLDLAGLPADDPPTVTLAAPRGTLGRNGDGSLTVLDADDDPVGGLSAPTGARFVVDGEAVEVRPAGGDDGDGPGEAATTLGTAGVASADWGEREGGRSLAVDATGWARSAGEAGVDVVWAELVAAEPEVDTATMRDQLACHAIGAPDKATWNLEPWRPDVGLLATMAARCNPTP
ncbi:hypothetical protein GCM10009809_36190 [Isoptericola hypogeus]|uniref:DUF2599 domain-containing protein n=1 Tax=Isoptericola hypogeus TaxID=300179 RepID=A0ABN2JSQ2_9MICO